MRGLVAIFAASLALLLSGMSPAAADDASTAGCPPQPDPVPGNLSERPVIYVHGWLGAAQPNAGPAELLTGKLGPGYHVLSFNYSWANQEWGASEKTRTCLAEYISKASSAYKASGADGRVLAVGHSMGGIVIRSAAAVLADNGEASSLAGVVTLGTPHQGSPWGGTVYADLLQRLNGLTGGTPLPAAASSAAQCLGWPRASSCAAVPYLPEGTRIATIGSQITIRRTLFDLPLIKSPTADIPLFGDSIVPALSANGYINSAKGAYPTGFFDGETKLECTEESSYLTQQLVKTPARFGIAGRVIATLALTIAKELVDIRALDTMLEGKADASQSGLVALAMASKCYHNELPNNDDAMTAVANYLNTMSPGSGGEPEADGAGDGTIPAPSASSSNEKLAITAELGGPYQMGKGKGIACPEKEKRVFCLAYDVRVTLEESTYWNTCAVTWTFTRVGSTTPHEKGGSSWCQESIYIGGNVDSVPAGDYVLSIRAELDNGTTSTINQPVTLLDRCSFTTCRQP